MARHQWTSRWFAERLGAANRRLLPDGQNLAPGLPLNIAA